jgi:hypothetical protein
MNYGGIMVEIHFISTGPFRYLHMIAVMTAALMQCAERINVYFINDTLDTWAAEILEKIKEHE